MGPARPTSEGLNRKADTPPSKREFFLTDGLELKHWLFLSLELASLHTGTKSAALLGLQLTDSPYRSRDSPIS